MREAHTGPALSESVKGYETCVTEDQGPTSSHYSTVGFFFFYIYIKTPWLGHLIVFVSQTELRHCFIFTRLTNSLLYLWLTR